MSILMIDNYDSFVYNLVQYVGELGADPIVRRNDEIDLAEVDRLDPEAILVSPGPGTPATAGISNSVIADSPGKRPVFGVCLGMQCIGAVFGASIVRAPQVMHGKTSRIDHDGTGVFAGLPNPLDATRYHSLIVDRATLPDVLEVTAESSDGLVMGLRHRDHAIEGVQFHPESILTTAGHQLIENFLTLTRS